MPNLRARAAPEPLKSTAPTAAAKSAAAGRRLSSVPPPPLALTPSQEMMPPPPVRRQKPPTTNTSKIHSRNPSGSSDSTLTTLDGEADDEDDLEGDIPSSAASNKGKKAPAKPKKDTVVINWGNEFSSRAEESRSSQDALYDYLVEPGVWGRLKEKKQKKDMERIRTHLMQLGYGDRSLESIRAKLRAIASAFKETYNRYFMDSGGGELHVNKTEEETINAENPAFFFLYDTFVDSSSGMAPRFRWDSIRGQTVGVRSKGELQDDEEDAGSDVEPNAQASSSSSRLRAPPTPRGKRSLAEVLHAARMDGPEFEEDGEDGEGERGGKRARMDLAEIEEDDEGVEDFYDEDLDSDTKPTKRTPARLRPSSDRPMGKKSQSATDVMASAMSQIAGSAASSQSIQVALMKKQDKRADVESEREERRLKLSEESTHRQNDLATRQLAMQEASAKAEQFATLTRGGMPAAAATQIVYGFVLGGMDGGGGGGGALGGGGGFGGMAAGMGPGGFRAPGQLDMGGGYQGDRQEDL